jgi:CRISPR-associated protein Csm4
MPLTLRWFQQALFFHSRVTIMSRWKLVRLQFGKSLAHFGKQGIGMEEANERIHSDTLFSAWVSAYARLFGKTEVEALLERFQDPSQYPFRLSSTFIYKIGADDEMIYYLPRPLQFPQNYPIGEDLKFAKAYKALRYLPISLWQRWYQGTGFDASDLSDLPDVDKTYKKAYKTHKIPKVAIDRDTRATNFYHTGAVQYRYDLEKDRSLSGLYFLVEFPQPDAELENDFMAVLSFLGEEGIGGERSSGAGQFKPDLHTDLPDLWQQTIAFSKSPDHQNYSLLSLFWEQSLQTKLDHAQYELQERGGWIASPSSDGRQLRRQMVQMFTEGSVFPFRPQGKLADVTPTGDRFRDHKVYRSGISLSLPIRTGEPS